MVNENQILFPATRTPTARRACSDISLTILDDLVVETNETVQLVAVFNDMVITEPMSIAIVDDDGESTHSVWC